MKKLAETTKGTSCKFRLVQLNSVAEVVFYLHNYNSKSSVPSAISKTSRLYILRYRFFYRPRRHVIIYSRHDEEIAVRTLYIRALFSKSSCRSFCVQYIRLRLRGTLGRLSRLVLLLARSATDPAIQHPAAPSLSFLPRATFLRIAALPRLERYFKMLQANIER